MQTFCKNNDSYADFEGDFSLVLQIGDLQTKKRNRETVHTLDMAMQFEPLVYFLCVKQLL